MINPNGTIVLNGITDHEMVRIWEFKAKNEGAFSFNPAQFQITRDQQGRNFNNNVSFTCTGEAGLRIMHEILGYLLKKEEKAEAVGQ